MSKISELQAASTITGVEIIPIVQGGATKRSTVGTAAARNVGTAAGNVMEVGAFGLGQGITATVDWNNYKTTGFFIGDGLANAPIAGGIYVAVTQYTTTYAIQKAENLEGTLGFVRALINGTWNSWARIYSQKNILGSVSQTAGVPTGAVIERGSNANGEYVRFADGTQICTSPLITVPGTGWNATGLGFKYSNGIYNTLPANFVTAPVILVQIRDGAVAGRSSWLTYSDATTGATTAYLACVSASVETSNLQIAITTIGRWF